MRKTALTILIAVLVSVSAAAALGQTYAVPRAVPIKQLARKTFPQYFRSSTPYRSMVPETFFPIGWSRDGKFAYYVEPVDEACGCYFAHLVIQDMRTDKIVWEFKYNQDDTRKAGSDKMAPEDTIAKLWRKNSKLFSKKLAENGIVASRSAILGMTFTIGGKSFTAKLAEELGKNPDEGDRRVNRYTITLSSPKLGTKTVFTSEDHTKDEYWFMLDAGLIGAIKSPFENRVAIIAMEVARGYEGPPHSGNIQIVGADLTSGFKR